MIMNFASPATTDNYSTAFVPNIQANQTAIAQMLDSTNVTITGTPPTYAKRYNRTTTYLEEYSGTTWATLPHRATDSDKLNGQLPAYYQIALGFTPYNATNPNNYISGITSGNVTTALGYTPANPSSVDSIIAPPSGGNEVGRYLDFHASTNANDYDVRLDSGTTTVSGTGNNILTIYAAGGVVINGPLYSPGVITSTAGYSGITSSNVTNALGYTPLSSVTAGLGLSGGTITTSGTIALITTAGAIGTYMLAAANAAAYNFGVTVAGSTLTPAGATYGGGGVLYFANQAAAQSGTWQCMGYSPTYSGGTGITLWIRIA